MAQLLLAIFLPIVLSPLAYILGARFSAKSGWFSFFVLLSSTLLFISAVLARNPYVEAYPWPPIGEFGWRADGLSLPFAIIILTLSTVLAVYSMPYMVHRIREEAHEGGSSPEGEGRRIGLYYLLFLLYVAGMAGAVLATNLIQFYIFFELMLIPSYFLIAEFGYGERDKISFMYFVWTHIGALVLLAGLLSLGFLSGVFDIPKISEAEIPVTVRSWVALAITIGLFVKLAAFGVHIWLPHAHAEAPTPISALLSPAMIGIGGYAIIRLVTSLLPSAYLILTLFFGVWALITMVYGGLMALAQDDIKRLLAYSSISQMGYIILGISSAYFLGLSGSVYTYMSHGTGKAILFMTAGIIILQADGQRSISKLGGLARRLPITATCAMIGFLTILGLPPLNGFQAEWMLFAGVVGGALEGESMVRLAIAVLALVSTPITVAYCLWTMRRIFFGPLPSHLSNVKEASPLMTAPLLILATLTVIFGVFPALITDRLIPLLQGVLTTLGG